MNQVPLTPETRRVVDPVCGNYLDPDQAMQIYEFHDQTWYFDSADCLKQFLDDPEAFTKIQPE